MARKLDPYRETARMALEPWLVEAALARLDRELSSDEQRMSSERPVALKELGGRVHASVPCAGSAQ